MIEVRYIYDYKGKKVNEYTISKGPIKISALNIGASITKLIVENRENKRENIMLRYLDYRLYKQNEYYFGCVFNFNSLDYSKLNLDCDVSTEYYQCKFIQDGLVFMNESQDSVVIYSIKKDTVIIEYDQHTFPITTVLPLNLSGNCKELVGNHTICFDHDGENEQKGFAVSELFRRHSIKHYISNSESDAYDLTLYNEQNGVGVKLYSSSHEYKLSSYNKLLSGLIINKRLTMEPGHTIYLSTTVKYEGKGSHSNQIKLQFFTK
ncbi:hypothetical protein [Haloplasma contractile]|uniref:Aldose 1-epimerase protein n=1 Tax=Haloplasma contractile SSD-17B TaxID=1033810 RepID=U2FJJ3_9MOLU|nr:hypothetical protein [Haloplasma contractile]ERJ12995.1 aldose 1-epimerase protein [Haloplasma contractile SSD-17B]